MINSLFLWTLIGFSVNALRVLDSTETYLTDCDKSSYLLDEKGVLLRESDGEVILADQCDVGKISFNHETAVQVCNPDGQDLTNIISNWGGVSCRYRNSFSL